MTRRLGRRLAITLAVLVAFALLASACALLALAAIYAWG